jgi:hypothetical protein
MTDHAARVDNHVKNYVALRDKIKAIKTRHEEELQPFTDMQNELTTKLQETLDTSGAQSIKTSGGTVYSSVRYSASLSDPQDFMKFVIANSLWDLLDRKANATAVRDYIAEKKVEPPGVKLSALRTIGVRRAGDA